MPRYVYDSICVRVGKFLVLYVMFYDWMYALKGLGLSFDLLGHPVMAHFERLRFKLDIRYLNVAPVIKTRNHVCSHLLLTLSPASLKKKIKILNAVIKPSIAYAYYVVPFSKLDIMKLERLINKLTKEICNIPKNTANILTHLPHEIFSISITSRPTRLHILHRPTTNTSPQRPRITK